MTNVIFHHFSGLENSLTKLRDFSWPWDTMSMIHIMYKKADILRPQFPSVCCRSAEQQGAVETPSLGQRILSFPCVSDHHQSQSGRDAHTALSPPYHPRTPAAASALSVDTTQNSQQFSYAATSTDRGRTLLWRRLWQPHWCCSVVFTNFVAIPG